MGSLIGDRCTIMLCVFVSKDAPRRIAMGWDDSFLLSSPVPVSPLPEVAIKFRYRDRDFGRPSRRVYSRVRVDRQKFTSSFDSSQRHHHISFRLPTTNTTSFLTRQDHNKVIQQLAHHHISTNHPFATSPSRCPPRSTLTWEVVPRATRPATMYPDPSTPLKEMSSTISTGTTSSCIPPPSL